MFFEVSQITKFVLYLLDFKYGTDIHLIKPYLDQLSIKKDELILSDRKEY